MSEVRLLPEPEARERLGSIGRSTWFRLKREGYIKSVRIGRRSFVREDELDRYIDSLSEQEAS